MKSVGRPFVASTVAAAAIATITSLSAQQPRVLAVTHATVLDVRTGSR